MKLFKKLISIVLVLTVLITSNIFTQAAETAPTAPDSPSNWALWDVQMSSIYGLGSVENYKQYTSIIKGSQFLTVQASLEKKFAIVDETKVTDEKTMTRGDIVNELYDVIKLVLKLDTTTDKNTSLNYFVNEKLIYGITGEYALDRACTQQEMLAFSQRVYEYLVYELGLEAKGAFWEVSDGDNTVYLLGSVHATDGSVYPMSKDILIAFANSDAVVVEANVLVPNAEETAYMQQLMMIEGQGTLGQLISKETYEAYSAIMKSVGVPIEVYAKLKPWAAAMTIQSILMSNASYNASMGIDVFFLSLAYNWKPIIELEGIKFQVDMFDSFSPELQEAYLEGSLKGDDASGDMMTQMLSMWKSGNMEELEKLVFAEEATTVEEKEFNQKLWDTRNKNMIVKIKDMLVLDKENDYFVIVGAGHMLNDNGIVQGLIDLGYKVDQVN
ncbi:MAG: GumN family protein [Clostridiales bacterium]|jgi:uncharacterized protein YbaP (TraB family)|nr:GumN family protein [Clostridiales bacterium]